jgi:hypothetical protein
LIPDQYSLGYAHQNYLRRTYRPCFTFFETVSTHAPWGPLPPLVDDWRTLNQKQTRPLAPDTVRLAFWQDLVLLAQRTALKARYHLRIGGALDHGNYFQHITYDWNVIRDYIMEKAPDNSLFIIVGDHQPPILPTMESGFGTPLHLISRDADLIQLSRKYGFTAGLQKDPDRSDTLRHEGIFSLLVRLLTEHYGAWWEGSPPQYHPAGVPFPRPSP